ncbi:hypothetical protein HK104_007934, partial [Borealophlyctis nickersoniae]
MVAFLDDFESFMNTATGNGQPPIAPAPALVPSITTTTQSEFDSIEALLFGANEILQPQQQQQTFQNPMI